MEQSSVAERGKKTHTKIQFGHLKRSHLLSEAKRGFIASGSATTAGKLNKLLCCADLCQHRPRSSVRRGSSTAGYNYAEGSEKLPSEVLLHYPFYQLSCRITGPNLDGRRARKG